MKIQEAVENCIIRNLMCLCNILAGPVLCYGSEVRTLRKCVDNTGITGCEISLCEERYCVRSVVKKEMKKF
jgi:hypothetical protein